MIQAIRSQHEIDSSGNPAGGDTRGLGLEIRWQNGPLAEGGVRLDPNGAFVETIIVAAIDRLRFYQHAPHHGMLLTTGSVEPRGKFACRENALAITHLEEALHWLQARTADREARGVEGTHQL
jgi:hypothetical protein